MDGCQLRLDGCQLRLDGCLTGAERGGWLRLDGCRRVMYWSGGVGAVLPCGDPSFIRVEVKGNIAHTM